MSAEDRSRYITGSNSFYYPEHSGLGHQFHIYGKDYGITYDGGIGFLDNPFQVVIDDFEFDVGDRFTYEYNFFEHWIHDIRVEAIYENSTLKTPFCINGHSMPGATAADEFDKTWRFLKLSLMQMMKQRLVRFALLQTTWTLSGLTVTKSTCC